MTYKKVLFVRFSSLGDIITSNYYAMGIKKKHPEWQLTWLVDALYAPLVRMQPWIDSVIEWDRKNTGNRGFLKILRDVRAEKYDILVDMHGSDRMAGFCFLSGIPKRIGRKHEWIPFGIHESNVFSELLEGDDEMHLSCKYLFSGEATQKVAKLKETFARPTLVLAIGASFKKKRWPAQSWVEFCRLCIAKNWQMVLIGSGEEEMMLAHEITDVVENRCLIDLVGQLSILDLVQVIDAGDIIIAGDTGPLHIGRALGIDTIGLFGPTLVEKNYMENLTQVFYSDCENIECENWLCEKPCLETILPGTVFACAEDILSHRCLSKEGY